MGLFDAFKGKAEPKFDKQRAVMTIMVAGILADGSASEEEVGLLRAMCLSSPIFSSNTREQDDAVIDFALKTYKDFGFDAVTKAAATLSASLRETAFLFATEIVMSDGSVGSSEEAFISKLAGSLGIADSLAHRMIEVGAIRIRSA